MVPGVFLVGECAAATMFAGGVAGPWPRVFIASERVRSLGARVPTAPAAAGEDFLSILRRRNFQLASHNVISFSQGGNAHRSATPSLRRWAAVKPRVGPSPSSPTPI